MNEDIKLAVKKGTAWLDENHPGWVSKIDLSNLQMSNCERCIIGQAVGQYWQTIAREARKLRECGFESETDEYLSGNMWAAEHGFDISPNPAMPDHYVYTRDYKQLESAWVEVVKDRLGRL